MRPTRAALFVAATALTPALLLSAPAFAAAPTASSAAATAASTTATAPSDTPVDEMTEAQLRAAIADILTDNNGEVVVREANKALGGTVDDMRTFLKTGYQEAQFEDDRFTIFTILSKAEKDGDRAVYQGCQDTLKADTPEAFRDFLETGYPKAQFQDDRVAIFTLLSKATNNGDKAVIQGCNDALAVNTPEALHDFRNTGYRVAQAQDDRVYIFRLISDPNISDALRDAADAALADGSPEALREFRETGQYEVDG